METIERILTASTMTLATVGVGGEPHATPLYFVADPDLNLYFYSKATSRHARDLESNPFAAVAVYPEVTDWRRILGLQMRGRGSPVEPRWMRQLAWKLYRRKFPFADAFRMQVVRNRLYVFAPTWVRVIDNSQGLGFKKEWTVEKESSL